MSRFSGRQGRGAMKRYRIKKREEAEIRNELFREHLEQIALALLEVGDE